MTRLRAGRQVPALEFTIDCDVRALGNIRNPNGEEICVLHIDLINLSILGELVERFYSLIYAVGIDEFEFPKHKPILEFLLEITPHTKGESTFIMPAP
jgi:hypothetical protein